MKSMVPPRPTAYAKDLEALGLDVSKLPPMGKLSGDQLRKVMKTFTKSLGAKCNDCHEADFAAPTPRKKIARAMWDRFVLNTTTAEGGAVFCDSCHQGHLEYLDKSNKKALSGWMDENFEHGLARADKKEMGCDGCHGDPFEGDILKVWAQGKRVAGAF
jgi:hypothetical protein